MNQLKSTWLIAFVVAFIISIVLLCLVEANKLKGFEGTLVAVNVVTVTWTETGQLIIQT
jgi:hypothetical protein